eukprot:scpid111682/ scgid31695/ 
MCVHTYSDMRAYFAVQSSAGSSAGPGGRNRRVCMEVDGINSNKQIAERRRQQQRNPRRSVSRAASCGALCYAERYARAILMYGVCYFSCIRVCVCGECGECGVCVCV